MLFSQCNTQSNLKLKFSASTVSHGISAAALVATPEDSEVRVSIFLNNKSCKTP